MAAVTICSDLGAPKKHCIYLFIHISGRSFLHKISSLGKKTMLFILLSLITSSTKHDNCMCYTLLLLEMYLRAQEKNICVCVCVCTSCVYIKSLWKQIEWAQLLSHVWLFATTWTVACQVPLSKGFLRKNTGVGCHFLLQGIFPTQGSNFRHEDKFTMLFIQQIK